MSEVRVYEFKIENNAEYNEFFTKCTDYYKSCREKLPSYNKLGIKSFIQNPMKMSGVESDLPDAIKARIAMRAALDHSDGVTKTEDDVFFVFNKDNTEYRPVSDTGTFDMILKTGTNQITIADNFKEGQYICGKNDNAIPYIRFTKTKYILYFAEQRLDMF